MKNLFAVFCAIVLMFSVGDVNAGLRCCKKSRCCPQPKCCQPAPTCCAASSCCDADAAISVGSQAVFVPSGTVDLAPASDCGCDGGIQIEGGNEFVSDDFSAPTPAEGVIEGAPVEGDVIEGSEVPASPVLEDSSSYFGAPALNPGEWIEPGSDVLVVDGDATPAATGTAVQPVSTSDEQVIYEGAEETSAAGDAVPSAPAEDATPEEEAPAEEETTEA